mmetsp:Transcript_47741/g.76995  ORF Transcript_47741/g.76995 Transcript_47741/m.76995 type:complete len:225 (-) Transcript_47741:25-699(-)
MRSPHAQQQCQLLFLHLLLRRALLFHAPNFIQRRHTPIFHHLALGTKRFHLIIHHVKLMFGVALAACELLELILLLENVLAHLPHYLRVFFVLCLQRSLLTPELLENTALLILAVRQRRNFFFVQLNLQLALVIQLLTTRVLSPSHVEIVVGATTIVLLTRTWHFCARTPCLRARAPDLAQPHTREPHAFEGQLVLTCLCGAELALLVAQEPAFAFAGNVIKFL